MATAATGLTTTPSALGACGYSTDGFRHVCTSAAPDTAIAIADILDNDGPQAAIWALRACAGADQVSEWLARWAALRAVERHSGELWTVDDKAVDYLRTGSERLRSNARQAQYVGIYWATNIYGVPPCIVPEVSAAEDARKAVAFAARADIAVAVYDVCFLVMCAAGRRERCNFAAVEAANAEWTAFGQYLRNLLNDDLDEHKR